MRGIGRASGAITIVNALPTGVGCALGIGLFAVAEVSLQPVRSHDSGHPGGLRAQMDSRTPLVETTARLALSRWGSSGSRITNFRLRSEIPPGRGLKSSSAVSCAIARAIASAAGARPTDLEIGLLSSEASRATGVSATGALDDALAGIRGGFVVTDNLRGELLRTSPPGRDWATAMFIPETTHSPSPQWAARFRNRASEGRAAVTAALDGDWWEAMALNTELVERTMGYEYRALRERLMAGGALGVGVSGLGPALAAIAPSERVERLRQALPKAGGQRTVARVWSVETAPTTGGE